MTSVTTRSAVDTPAETRGFAGHPSGLATLFFTEMWERFSYYGMRAFLILYMVAPAAQGGLGFADADAASIYGTYTGAAWGAAIFGGLVADRFLGQYRTVLVGGVIIALGHFVLAFKALPFFYTGLTFVALGTGLLKPNVSTLVGSLYEPGDRRRDAGFSIFYMGINLGALLGPLIAGYLAQRVNWHIGFSAAGVGMTAGLIQYALGKRKLQAAVDRLAAQSQAAPAAGAATTGSATPGSAANVAAGAPNAGSITTTTGHGLAFTANEWARIGAIVVFFLFATLFWGAYEQAGSTLTLFADRYTRLSLFGFEFPSSWFQMVQPACVIMFAPIFAWLWLRLGSREPSSPAKFALGLVFAGLAFMLLMPAAATAQSTGIRVSPWWLITAYAITELGELCISPVGLSLVTKLAPLRILGLMMGVWFLSNSAGNKLAGYAASFFSTMPLDTLFGTVAAITIVAGLILAVMVKPIRRMMGGVL
jgi:proton-dependent oligopeptide transporter, POT family